MLPEIVRQTAIKFSNSAAYISQDGNKITYRELDQISQEVAAWMGSKGLGEGSVVALCLPSCIEYILSYLAAAKLGAITAGINPRFTNPEQLEVLEVLRPNLILTTSDIDSSKLNNVEVEKVQVSAASGEFMPNNRIQNQTINELPSDPDRAVCICFTSGSTGTPKGALFTNRQLQAISTIDTGGAWGGAGHRYASTEFAHVGVMTKLPWLLASGGTTHLMEKWRAEPILRLIHDNRIAAVSAIAPQVALMLKVEGADRFDFSCVKAIVSGGALAPPELVKAGRDFFDAPWSIRYSSTESGGVGLGTSLDADDQEALHTVGRPRLGVEASIRDDQGQLVTPGEIGEIWLRSDAIMSCYWNDPLSTKETIIEGWLKTGDLAFQDPNGCFHLAGRINEMFIRGGYNIFPLEIEKVLSAHQSISEVAVIPRKDEVMGEIGVAVIVPKEFDNPPSLEDLRNHSQEYLAQYKLPEAIRIVETLPRNTSDKIDRLKLREYEDSHNGV